MQLHPFLSTILESRVPNPPDKMFKMKTTSPIVSLQSTADPGMQGTSPDA